MDEGPSGCDAFRHELDDFIYPFGLGDLEALGLEIVPAGAQHADASERENHITIGASVR